MKPGPSNADKNNRSHQIGDSAWAGLDTGQGCRVQMKIEHVVLVPCLNDAENYEAILF